MLPRLMWFRRAADAGHADAQCYLGSCYANGHGIGVDATQAVMWLRRAADAGHAQAMIYLGLALHGF